VGSLPSAVALAHLTGSGHLDIVTANSGSNNVSVLLGNGDSTFQKAVNYGVGTAPVALLVNDANGDGKQEIITANNGSNNASLLTGNSDGTFGTATTYALATGATAPSSIAAGDLGGAAVRHRDGALGHGRRSVQRHGRHLHQHRSVRRRVIVHRPHHLGRRRQLGRRHLRHRQHLDRQRIAHLHRRRQRHG